MPSVAHPFPIFVPGASLLNARIELRLVERPRLNSDSMIGMEIRKPIVRIRSK